MSGHLATNGEQGVYAPSILPRPFKAGIVPVIVENRIKAGIAVTIFPETPATLVREIAWIRG